MVRRISEGMQAQAHLLIREKLLVKSTKEPWEREWHSITKKNINFHRSTIKTKILGLKLGSYT